MFREKPPIDLLTADQVAFLVSIGELEVEYEEEENVIETVELILPPGFTSRAEVEDKLIWTLDDERAAQQTTLILP